MSDVWSDWRTTLLFELCDGTRTAREIAQTITASTAGPPVSRCAVLGKAKRLKIEKLFVAPPMTRGNTRHKPRETPKDTTSTRKCLGCQKPFVSWGKGNRLCGNCHAVGATKTGPDYSVTMLGWRF